MSLAYDLITSSAGPALGFADKLQREHMGAAAALARALGTGIRGLMMSLDRDAVLLADVRAVRPADAEPLPISYEAALAADRGRAQYGIAGLRGPAEEVWSGAHDAADQIVWDAIYAAAGRPPAPPPRHDAHRSLTEYGRPAPGGEVSLACLWASTAIREAAQGLAAPTTGWHAPEPRGALPAPPALRGALLPQREAHRGAAGGRLVRWLALAGLLATCATGERGSEPSCSSACYVRTSAEGPECWCTGPRPCQTHITAGACP
jgi:hypothetical protein